MNTTSEVSPAGLLFLKFRMVAFVFFAISLGMCFAFALLKETTSPNLHPLILVYSLRSVAVSGFIVFGIDLILLITKWPRPLGWAGRRIPFIFLGFAIWATGAINQIEWLQVVGPMMISLSVLSLVGILPDFKKGN